MATSASVDTAEDVADFLRRIKELGNHRDEEEAERTRKLEEEIMQSRRQREARRAERTRSQSPEKQSNPGTPRSTRSPSVIPVQQSFIRSSSSIAYEPKKNQKEEIDMTERVLPHGRDHSLSEGQCTEPKSRTRSKTPTDTFASNITLSRSATLSWQQRPTSTRSARDRPLSMVERQTSPSPPSAVHPEQEYTEPTHADIAKTLESRDVSYFRQTPDRGLASAAYRKSQVEETETVDHGRQSTIHARQLHGLSYRPQRHIDPARSARPLSPSPSASNILPPKKATVPIKPDSPSTNFNIRDLPPTTPNVQFPHPMPESRVAQAPTARDNITDTNSRFDTRSPSPTKGLGGFVSSAMLRSDSASKRWNVQTTGSGLARQDSTVRNRRLGRSESKEESILTRTPPSEGGCVVTDVRPIRQQCTETVSSAGFNHNENTKIMDLTSQQESHVLPAPPASPHNDRASTVSTPSSPSKRWSPSKNKSSWLESALGKPDSPKPQAHSPVRGQPAWLADLNKNRQQRLSKDIPSLVASQVLADVMSSNIADASSACVTPDERPKQAKSLDMPELKPKPARLSGGLPATEDVSEHHKKSSVSTGDSHDRSSQITLDPALAGTAEATRSTSKPVTPPKPDFRSQLRSTPTSPEKTAQEPEFRAAFGKLKRAQTQNYKAPDVLKDNILAGKAALSLTGGPQKTARRDDFKESLLERKKTMKDNAPDPNLLHKPKPSTGNIDSSVPEAIARRRAMTGGKPNASSQNTKALSTSQNTASPEIQRNTTQSARQLPDMQPLAAKPSSGKLADRFNASLSNVIARGPIPSPPADLSRRAKERDLEQAVCDVPRQGQPVEEQTQSSGQLQHITRTRAKGPKRKAPKGKTTTMQDQGKSGDLKKEQIVKQPPSSPMPTTSASIHPSAPQRREKPSPLSSSRKVSMPMKAAIDNPTGTDSSKPSPSPGKDTESSDKLSYTRTSQRNDSVSAYSHDVLQTPRTSTASQVHPAGQGRPPSDSVMEVKERWGERVAKPTVSKAKLSEVLSSTPSAISAPAGALRKPLDQPAPNLDKYQSASSEHTKTDVTPSRQTKPNSPADPANERSPTPQAPNAQSVLQDYFGALPTRLSRLDVDTATILAAPSGLNEKIMTIRKSIEEIFGDGKSSLLPPQQEHILYNESMYLCTHVFEDESGTRMTDVYLWIGRGVSESAMQDVHVFAKRTARENNGVLVSIRQGTENARFLQALGGILVTRDRKFTESGSSGWQKAMLCGRRYLGHMVFDEVDLRLSGLTAACPFLVQAPSGRTYLWKGLGCHPEEIGAARLTAMDIAAASEIVEVEQGREPMDFIELFPEPRQMPRSAEHWKYKPGQENYRNRLFKVSCGPVVSSGGQINALWNALKRQPPGADGMSIGAQQTAIEEIIPFEQSNLDEEHVYVLDAFFEIYILPAAVSRAASSQSAFAAALLFAQEYGILAASSEDRPFVPIGTVVLSGVPRDMKASFRTWDERYFDSAALLGGSGSGRRGPLKILGLASALSALKAG